MKTTEKSQKQLPSDNRTKIGKLVAVLGSFLGALFIWIYAIGYDSTLFERTFNGIEVVFVGEEELRESLGFTLPFEQESFSITVVAKGKRAELNEMQATDFKATIDLSTANEAGEQTFEIVVTAPNGIEIVEQSSTTATLVVDEFTTRPQLLNVNPDKSYYTTQYAEDIVSHKYDVNPKTVVVEGPKSILEQIAEVYIDFDLEGKVITDDIKGWGAIELRDKDGNKINNPYIKLSETTGYFMIEVVKEKTVPVKYAFKGEVDFQPLQGVTLSHDSITVQGTSLALANFNEYVITIDETAVGKNTKINHLVALPDKISRAEGTPSEIEVKVDLRDGLNTKVFSFSKDEITVKGLPEGASCNIKNNIDITVVGLREVVALLRREKVLVSIDFAQRTPNPDGSFKAEIIIEFAENVVGVYGLNEGKTVSFTVNYN